jgi:hypothetical protein
MTKFQFLGEVLGLFTTVSKMALELIHIFFHWVLESFSTDRKTAEV